jgi:Domain of unknown function (DUF4124)
MRKWLILLFAMWLTAATGTPAWTWVDGDGQVHFADRPVPGARQVELSGAQGFGAPARAQPAATSAPSPPAEGAATEGYRSIEILTPAEQETLWNIGATLNVRVQMDPALRPGQRIDLALDGQRRNLNAGNLQLTLPNVFRGAHTLQVVVIDAEGVEVARSPVRDFFVQQTSIQNPNSIGARRP